MDVAPRQRSLPEHHGASRLGSESRPEARAVGPT
jgi:hypothetical protein